MLSNPIYTKYYNPFCSAVTAASTENKSQQPFTFVTLKEPVYINKDQEPENAGEYLEAALGMADDESNILFDERARAQREIWDNEFNEWFNSDIASLKGAAKGKAVSIFDKEEISSGIKAFLEDKPITAIRYQRLYEQNPAKAEIFITSMMEDYSLDFYSYLDVKYQGQAYMAVLEHINALLEKNIKDVENGFTDRAMKYQYVFAMDDDIGSNDNSQIHVSKKVEYEPGKYTTVNYLKLYKPVGRGESGAILLEPKSKCTLISDKGLDMSVAKIDEIMKAMFFGTRYWYIR